MFQSLDVRHGTAMLPVRLLIPSAVLRERLNDELLAPEETTASNAYVPASFTSTVYSSHSPELV